ncbi:glucokinase [Klebsiella michiganensis]|nr:glucokinase [Klebsiella michiganensis]
MILEELRSELGHVSAERVLSGPGLVNLYHAIVKSDGRLPENLQPKDVTERALVPIPASIAAARCRCFASLWADLAVTWR